jgi:bifunctional DNA-binding transcriptional regulator/antitoxin component of YhaV-PrlF toxin-antitoxin module
MTEARFFTKRTRKNNGTLIVTIPIEICEVLGIESGDLLDIKVSKVDMIESK